MLGESIVWHPRFKWLLLGITSFVIATWLYFGHYLDGVHISRVSVFGSSSTSSQSSKSAGASKRPLGAGKGLSWPEAPNQLWRVLQPLLDENAPDVPSPNYGFPKPKSEKYNPDDNKPLMDKLSMPMNDVLKMSQNHQKFLDGMTSLLPEYVPTKDAPKRGIVTVAGGYHFPIFFVSLRMLRRTGTNLPVEVFLPNQGEYEKEICEDVLPSFNAKCVVLTDIFDHDNFTHKPAIKIEHFQYKIFSVLFSSFEEVLFLDSDSFPLYNPEPLFYSEPFSETGLITWPDFWASSASPLYYLISRQESPPLSARPTMESGQFLVSKSRHYQTLLLVAYYNYFGPSHYYDLLCQGGAGRGDKETFHPAALALNSPFYAVSQPVKGIGHPKKIEGEFYVFAMIQHDLLQDYERTQHGRKIDKPKPFFLHTNTPKWNAKNVFDHSLPYDLTWDLEQHEVPAYTVPKENVAEVAGVERQLWEELRWVGCKMNVTFKDFREANNVCGKIEDYFNRVLEPKPESGKENHEENKKEKNQTSVRREIRLGG